PCGLFRDSRRPKDGIVRRSPVHRRQAMARALLLVGPDRVPRPRLDGAGVKATGARRGLAGDSSFQSSGSRDRGWQRDTAGSSLARAAQPRIDKRKDAHGNKGCSNRLVTPPGFVILSSLVCCCAPNTLRQEAALTGCLRGGPAGL